MIFEDWTSGADRCGRNDTEMWILEHKSSRDQQFKASSSLGQSEIVFLFQRCNPSVSQMKGVIPLYSRKIRMHFARYSERENRDTDILSHKKGRLKLAKAISSII